MHSAEVPEETAMEILDSLSVVLLAVPGMAHLTQAPGKPASRAAKNLVSRDFPSLKI